jgi:hypothetical protein
MSASSVRHDAGEAGKEPLSKDVHRISRKSFILVNLATARSDVNGRKSFTVTKSGASTPLQRQYGLALASLGIPAGASLLHF